MNARAFNIGLEQGAVDIKHIFGPPNNVTRAYAKRVSMKAGAFIDKHVHDFDHISFLQHGTVRVERGSEQFEITGPCPVLIAARVEHKVVALTPALWFCMHITDETDPDKIDEVLTS